MENSIVKNISFINNLSFSKTKTKWEIIGKLTELYLKSGFDLKLEAYNDKLKKDELDAFTEDIKVQEKYRSEILELIRILVSSPT